MNVIHYIYRQNNNIMYRSAIFLISLFCVLNGYSQKEVATQQQLKDFFNTTTLVVKDDNPLMEYNVEIEEAVKKSWKLTEYEFISQEEFEEKRKDPKFSFITFDQVWFDKDKTKAKYNFLCLSLGGNYRTITEMPQLCTVPVSYLGVDEDTYIYKINTLLNFMQNHVLLTSKDPKLRSSNIIAYYNKNLSDVKNKTLYLVKDELAKEINSEQEIKSRYPHKFKIVDREDIKEAIKNEDPDVIFLHKIGPEGTKQKARCYKVIIGAKDARLYYFNYHMINDKNRDGLLEKDFKRLLK